MATIENSKGVSTFLAIAGLNIVWNWLRSDESKECAKTASSEITTPAAPARQPINIPVIDFATFFNKDADPESYKIECAKAAEAFHKYGVCIVKDHRVNESDNSR